MPACGTMVNDHSSAKSFAWRGATQNITVTSYSNHRLAQFELDPAFLPWAELFSAKQSQGGNCFAGAHKEFNFISMLRGRGGILQRSESRINAACGLILIGMRDHISAAHLFYSDA